MWKKGKKSRKKKVLIFFFFFLAGTTTTSTTTLFNRIFVFLSPSFFLIFLLSVLSGVVIKFK